MSKKARVRKHIVQIVEWAVSLYMMFACLWTICYLVGEILTKMGVG
jgi:hypothetical protein